MYVRLLTLFTAIIISYTSIAQLPNPVKWTFSSKKLNATTWEVHLTATIDTGWRLYAQQCGEGPVPTNIKFVKNGVVVPSGKVVEVGTLKKAHDNDYHSELKYYEKKVDFVQKVTVKGKSVTPLKGSIEFMAQDKSQTIPPKKVDFSITVGS